MFLAFLCQRYFLFTMGETGVVGVNRSSIALLVRWNAFDQRNGTLAWIDIGVGLQGLENPHLAPVPR